MPFIDGELVPAPRVMLHIKMISPWKESGTLEASPLSVVEFNVQQPKERWDPVRVNVTLYPPADLKQGSGLFDLKEPDPVPPPLPPAEQLLRMASGEPWMTWLALADSLEEEGRELELSHGLRQLARIQWLPQKAGATQWRFLWTLQFAEAMKRNERLFRKIERSDGEGGLVAHDYHPVFFKDAWECTMTVARALSDPVPTEHAAGGSPFIHGTPA
jgi:hypothetical protein